MTRNALIVDLFMRMIEFEPKSSDPQAWSKWAFNVNVAMGTCLSRELGGKLAEIVRIIRTLAEKKKMDSKTKKEYERVLSILRGLEMNSIKKGESPSRRKP